MRARDRHFLLRGESWLVAAAIALHWLLAASVSPRMGVTADEVVHLTGGWSYWKFNDYRLQPENGTLPMRVAALPLLGMDLKFPATDDPEWLNSKVNVVGEKFFHHLGNPVPEMLQRARAAIALFGVLTCWLVWRWARGLFGPVAGAVALALAVFCPALLAHDGLVTSDAAFTACALAALTAVWRLLHRATWGRLALATIACAACFLSKMSGAIIVPLIGALWLLRGLRATPLPVRLLGPGRRLRGRGAVLGATFALLLATAAGSLTLLWANYSFRFSPFNERVSPGAYYFPWEVLLDREPLPWRDESELGAFAPPRTPPRPHSALTRLVATLHEHRLLPDAYLWGFAHTAKFSRERPSFFLGEYRKTGWPLFFPVAFLMKSTPASLLVMAGGVLAVAFAARRPGPADPLRRVRRWRPLLYRAAPLLLFFVVYWWLAVGMTLNLGHRHILPVYPICYIAAGGAALALAGARARLLGAVLALAVAAHAADSSLARPFYLAYFQPWVGGPERAHRYFVESSLDWGQGLPDLAAWLQRLRASGDPAPVFLSYFGPDSPSARKLDVTRFGDELSDTQQRHFPAQVRGGWFVISATYYRRVALPMRATWGPAQEEVYRRLLARLADPAADRAKLLQTAMDVETLQFARLCRWLDLHREPLQAIGASLLVFRLGDAEVAAALYGPLETDPAAAPR